MEISLTNLKQNKHVKTLQRNADLLLMNKKEMYNALESVQEFFNRMPDTKFKGDKPHELDMVEKMNGLGFNIR